MREKAPGSGGPAAGNPNGVKSGEKLLDEVKNQMHGGGEAREDVAPAEASIRATNPDGSANPDDETVAETQEQAQAKIAEEVEKIDAASTADAEKQTAEEEQRTRESEERISRIASGNTTAAKEPAKTTRRKT